MRICLTYTTPVFHGTTYTLGIVGYVPDLYGYNYNTSAAARRRLNADSMPISIWMGGTGKDLNDVTAYRIPLEMAKRGYCGFSVQYARASPLAYCDGEFDVKASHIFSEAEGSAVDVIEKNMPFCSSERGLAASGFSQGSHIALLAREYNTRVSAVFLLSGGHTDVASCWTLGICNANSEAILMYSGHSDTTPRTIVRSVIGAHDDVFGNGTHAFLHPPLPSLCAVLTVFSRAQASTAAVA